MQKGQVNILKIDKYHVIIFDCDGIIFDTNALKLNAFKDSLSAFSNHDVKEFVTYFQANFGRSRYTHIKYFFSEILKIPFDKGLYDRILYDYGQRCEALYRNADICIGVKNLLEKTADVEKYIASGSNQHELRKAFQSRSLAQYFEAIYGSPINKNDLVKNICSQHEGKNILMIGDAQADYIAAQQSHIDFLYVERYSADNKNMKALASEKKFCSVTDLSLIPV